MPDARKARPYFVLAQRVDGRWTQQFGDYDRETVESESYDMQDHDVRRVDLKVVRVATARQAAIEAALAKLNAA